MSQYIHLGQRSTKHGYWTSFESDPYLTTVKSTIQYRCLPCIENLYRQLMERKQEIELGSALNCWKVVAVLHNEEECLSVLDQYQQKYLPDRHIRGRFGSKEESGTKAIVVNAENEQERDRLLSELTECVNEVNLVPQIFYSRACADLYEELLGDWRGWHKVTPIQRPENVPKVVRRLKDLLQIS